MLGEGSSLLAVEQSTYVKHVTNAQISAWDPNAEPRLKARLVY